MNNINEVQDEIIEEFSKLDDWFDKYEYIIKLGKNFEKLDEDIKNDKNSIPGCQSQVWIKAYFKDKKMHYLAEGDSLIVKGMIYLLLKVLNNRTPEEILNSDLYFIEKIGLSTNLSPSRANGLMSVLNQIRSYAKTYSNK